MGGVNPEEQASWLSILTWSWLDPLLLVGSKRALKIEDLYELSKEDTAAYCEQRWNECFAAEKSKRVWRVSIRFLGRKYFLLFLCRLIWLAATIGQVYALKVLLQRVSSKSELEWWRGTLLVVGIFFSQLLQCLLLNHQCCNFWRAGGLRLASAISMAIFNKVLSTRLVAFNLSSSMMHNVLANDIQKILLGVLFGPFVVGTFVSIPVVAIILVVEGGFPALAGVGVICLAQVIQIALGKRLSTLRRKNISATDARMGIIKEAVAGVRVLKLNGWIPVFLERIKAVRQKEMNRIKKSNYLLALIYSIRDATFAQACLVTFTVIVLRTRQLDAATAFVILALYGILARDFFYSVIGWSYCFEAWVSLERVQHLLTCNAGTNYALLEPQTKGPPSSLVQISDCDLSWNGPTKVLQNINLTVNKAEIIGICGDVGSGKSSLILGLLGELQVLHGSCLVKPVSIAYCPQEPWILNDTVLNNIVFDNIFDPEKYERVISACALKHDISSWPAGSYTEIGEQGINLSGGQKARVSLARAFYSDAPLIILDDPFSAIDITTTNYLIQNIFNSNQIRDNKSIILSTHSDICLNECDMIYEVTNRTIKSVLKDELHLLKYDQQRLIIPDNIIYINDKDHNKNMGQIVTTEVHKHGSIHLKRFFKYMQLAGWSFWIILVLIYILGYVSILMVEYWVQVWSDTKYNLSQYSYVIIFTCMVLVSSVMYLTCKFITLYITNLTAIKLHDNMLAKVFYSPTIFFDQNPTGRIINRFSKDQAATDDIFPSKLQETFEMIAYSIGSVLLISILIPWFLFTVPYFLFGFLYFRKRLVQISNDLKRLDVTTSSPIHSFFMETLQGVVAVRAYKVHNKFHNKLLELIDTNKKAVVLYVHSVYWMTLRLNIMSILATTFATILVITLRHSISAGIAGVVMVQSFKLNENFENLIKFLAYSENFFTSVERIQEYCSLLTETDENTEMFSIPIDWPYAGSIEFIDYTLAYRVDLPPVLKSISFKIQPREKVGIIGRTGAGKSSLVAALFRMVNNRACGGSIVVDNIDIKKVKLDYLRRKLSIIPQNPLLFSGTIRFNLDPFGVHDDNTIYSALKNVSLQDKIKCLDDPIAADGDSFSLGERQLLCLARTLLRKSKIIVLDEATASIDNQTDEILQATIREVFKECTVLTVAHRIHTIMDSDRILMLGSGGKILQFDIPSEVLKGEASNVTW